MISFILGFLLAAVLIIAAVGVLWLAYMILYFVFAVIIGNLFGSDS